MSSPAVFRALAALAGAWVVEFLVTEDSGAGRPAARSVPVECGHVTGVDIGPHELFVTVADPAGTVLAERRVVTPLGAAAVTAVRPSVAHCPAVPAALAPDTDVYDVVALCSPIPLGSHLPQA